MATTSTDWGQVASNLENQISELEKKQDEFTTQVNALSAQQNALRQQRNNLSAKLTAEGKSPSSDPSYTALVRDIDSINPQIDSLQNSIKQISSQITEKDAALQNAEFQASKANSTQPGLQVTSPPINITPDTVQNPVSTIKTPVSSTSQTTSAATVSPQPQTTTEENTSSVPPQLVQPQINSGITPAVTSPVAPQGQSLTEENVPSSGFQVVQLQPNSEIAPTTSTTPVGNNISSTGITPTTSTTPVGNNISSTGITPTTSTTPVGNNISSTGITPAVTSPVAPQGQSLTEENVPSSGFQVVQLQPNSEIAPTTSTTPVGNNISSTGITPTTSTTPVGNNISSTGITPTTSATPVGNNISSAGITPAVTSPVAPQGQSLTEENVPSSGFQVVQLQPNSGISDDITPPTVTQNQVDPSISTATTDQPGNPTTAPETVPAISPAVQDFLNFKLEPASIDTPTTTNVPLAQDQTSVEGSEEATYFAVRADENATNLTASVVDGESNIPDADGFVWYREQRQIPDDPLTIPDQVVAKNIRPDDSEYYAVPATDDQIKAQEETGIDTRIGEIDADGNLWFRKDPENVGDPFIDPSDMVAPIEQPVDDSEYQTSEKDLQDYKDAIARGEEITRLDVRTRDEEESLGALFKQIESNQQAEIDAARNSNSERESVIGKYVDWRFRISLAQNAGYFYKGPDPGILAPLIDTHGVLFPYTPKVTIIYNANYESTDIPHTNFKFHNYKNSSVDQISITGDFTAQDSKDASYLLAVIHFFKSVTKMFYGQDSEKGTPPPLCYLNGHGDYAFNEHPVLITNFTLNYPDDVDYIDARPMQSSSVSTYSTSPSQTRMNSSGLNSGGRARLPAFSNNSLNILPTQIPTKLQIQLSCLPVVSRKVVSNSFSLREYSNGKLLLGRSNSLGGGIW